MTRAARQLTAAAIGAAILVPVAVGAGAGQAATPPDGPSAKAAKRLTSAKVVQCQRGKRASERVATFRAGMVRVRGTSKMAVRLTLEESVAGGRYRVVRAPGLDVWRKSRRGVRAFAYRQRVKALVEGSAYRVKVHYRWYRASGRVFKTARRHSSSCRQTEPLPNLRVQRVGAGAIAVDGQVLYGISVINRGPVRAPESRVLLWVDGQVAGRAAVPALAAGQITRVFLAGPGCTTGVGAQADTDRVVRESDETDNVRAAPCPRAG